jgi:predicted DNA-binding transcriptional regulator AlpA
MSSAAGQQAAEMKEHTDEPRPRKMLNEKQVLQLVPISSTTLWRMQRQGRFPKGSYMSANRRCWFEDEIIEWQNSINGRGRGRKNYPAKS